MKLATALSRALKAMPMQPSDAATVELAKHYAAAIDGGLILEKLILTPTQEDQLKSMGLGRVVDAVEGDVLKTLGPRLLETLAELGMTPKARNTLVKGSAPNGSDSTDKLAEFRSRRERRAAHLDAASS